MAVTFAAAGDDPADSDDDLQAAIALSIQESNTSSSTAAVNNNKNDADAGDVDDGASSAAIIKRSAADSAATNNDISITTSPNNSDSNNSNIDSNDNEFDIHEFYKLMWDDATTTTNDKERWIYECISTPYLQQQQQRDNDDNHDNDDSGDQPGSCLLKSPPEALPDNNHSNISAAAAASPASSMAGAENSNHPTTTSTSATSATLPLLTPLEVFTGSHSQSQHQHQQPSNNNQTTTTTPPQQMWGLTQKHGGPCGVLAAIQAELIRILLFGRGGNTTTNNSGDGGSGGGGELYYPFVPTANDNYINCQMANIGGSEVEEALAMSIGMILARAAIMPSACTGGSTSSSTAAGDCGGIDGDGSGGLLNGRRPSVQIVLPDEHYSSDQSTRQDTNEAVAATSPSSASWIQQMISPSASSSSANEKNDDKSTSASSLLGLKVHTIPLLLEHDNDSDDALVLNQDQDQEQDLDQATVAKNEADAEENVSMPDVKRPRNKEVSFNFDNHPMAIDSGVSSSSFNSNSGSKPNNNATTTTATTHTMKKKLTPQQKKMTTLAKAVADFLLNSNSNSNHKQQQQQQSPPLNHFQQPGGVMYLVMSLVQSRSIPILRSDFDDPNIQNATTITSQFGHTSQELMNLLLTGQATSNVFDNSMVLSEELTCHGIQARSAIGYLSMLESLRYCEVGGYYKNPLFPIWVVGSTSHFSVLFGDETCLQESKSDVLLEKCRRAFKKVEGGGDAGFIPKDKLGEVIDELDLRTQVGGDSGVSTLQAYLEVSGAGIILWDDFWKAASRLMTGSSLEYVISSQDNGMQIDSNSNSNDDVPPLLITQFGEEDSKIPAAASATVAPAASVAAAAPTSDEELARKLAEEWGSMPDLESTNGQQTAPKSDEDYARELQAQWDAEMSGDVIDLTSQAATTDDVATLASVVDRPPTPMPEGKMEEDDDGILGDRFLDEVDAKMAANTAMMSPSGNTAATEIMTPPRLIASIQPQLEFEKHGQSFPLYHYNGLYGGTLTPFRLTRLSATEAVGASIALSSNRGSGHGGGGGDLEDVVRTKWPSSMLNWYGKNPPSID